MFSHGKLIEQLLAFGALGLLAIGCTLVLWPFLSAILWAAVICFSTWPAYRLFERALGGYRALAAAAMTVLVVVVIVAPLALLATTLADNISSLVAGVTQVSRARCIEVWGVSGLVESVLTCVEITDSEAAATIAFLWSSFETHVVPLHGRDLIGDFVSLDSSP